MNYTFHKCRPHPKCPDLVGWYLVLRPDDAETVMKLHRGVCCLYFFKFGMDPHIEPDGPYNPIKLAAEWLASVEHFMLAGGILLVNSNGGIMPMHGTKILDTVESDDLHWDDRFDDERITISRWPQGKHWYLCGEKVAHASWRSRCQGADRARHYHAAIRDGGRGGGGQMVFLRRASVCAMGRAKFLVQKFSRGFAASMQNFRILVLVVPMLSPSIVVA